MDLDKEGRGKTRWNLHSPPDESQKSLLENTSISLPDLRQSSPGVFNCSIQKIPVCWPLLPSQNRGCLNTALMESNPSRTKTP